MVLLESEQVCGALAAAGRRRRGALGRVASESVAGGTGVAAAGGRGLLTGGLALQFLTELTRLFQKCRLSGSVFITLKKCEWAGGLPLAGGAQCRATPASSGLLSWASALSRSALSSNAAGRGRSASRRQGWARPPGGQRAGAGSSPALFLLMSCVPCR